VQAVFHAPVLADAAAEDKRIWRQGFRICSRFTAERIGRFRRESGLYGCFPFIRVLAKTQSSGWL
jgi:hypothetical protein